MKQAKTQDDAVIVPVQSDHVRLELLVNLQWFHGDLAALIALNQKAWSVDPPPPSARVDIQRMCRQGLILDCESAAV